jgi:hypothetical protein
MSKRVSSDEFLDRTERIPLNRDEIVSVLGRCVPRLSGLEKFVVCE